MGFGACRVWDLGCLGPWVWGARRGLKVWGLVVLELSRFEGFGLGAFTVRIQAV